MTQRAYLGVDVGSVSTNIVVTDERAAVLCQVYARTNGDPIGSVQQALAGVAAELPSTVRIAGVCTTGSGRELIGAIVGADVVKNEITAHARGALRLHPEVRTIIEIGGQDSKVTVIRKGVVVDFAMNVVCAAGTGSFLDSQAKRLNISIEELSRRSVHSKNPTTIAGRCTVFAESDMIHKQQMGYEQVDILMGLCQAMTRNYVGNVCRGKELKPPMVFQGGVSANLGMRRALQEALSCELIVPRYHMVMGAYGAALIAAEAQVEHTRFKGFEVCQRHIQTRSFECQDCPNNCEVLEVLDSGQVLNRAGGRCRKWEGTSEERPPQADQPAPSTPDPVPCCGASPEGCADP